MHLHNIKNTNKLQNFLGKLQEYISCTSMPVTWNKPTVGRDVGCMSVYQILNRPKPLEQVDMNFTADVINKLINAGIDCPLTKKRRADGLSVESDHSYFHHFELQRLYLFQNSHMQNRAFAI